MTLPLWCDWMVLARDLAMRGQLRAAGRKYQALLVLSQLMELSIAVHATVEYADSVGELSLTLSRTTETSGNQMELLLAAALSEEPERIEHALREGAPALAAWRDYLAKWASHIQADAERMKVAKAAWDITIGVIAAYETAGALAELAAGGGPPIAPLPALAGVGGGAAAMELSGAAYLDLAEAIRRLIASGALDAVVVAALSAATGGGRSPSTPVGRPHLSQMAATNEPDLKAPTAGQEKLPWRPWDECEKVAVGDKVYAKIGGRLYTRHAVDRMQPSWIEPSPGGRPALGRSISPTYVEDVIRNGTTQTRIENGVERTIHTSGTVQVVTEQNGRIVVTVNPFSGAR